MATIRFRRVWVARDGDQIAARLFSEKAAQAHREAHPGHVITEGKLSKPWQAIIELKGYKPISKSFKTKALARTWVTNTESQMQRGQYVDTRDADKVLLSTLFDDYQTKVVEKRRDGDTSAETSRIKLLRKRLGHITLAALTDDQIVQYGVERIDDVMPSTLRRELTVLQCVWKEAVIEWGYKLAADPFPVAKARLERRRVLVPDGKRERRLRKGEESRLLGVNHTQTTLITQVIIVALETAMRRGEIAAAQREYFDKKASTLYVPKSKTDWVTGNKGRAIPLSPRAVAVLKKLPAQMDGSLFGMKPHSISQAFRRTCEMAGIEDLHLHDLRHEGTSRFFDRGYPIQEVAAITGHKDWRSLQRYTHPKTEDIVAKLKNEQKRKAG